MRSQSLFNFFTKAADVTQTAAGTRIHTGTSAQKLRSQTASKANAVYNAEQKRRSGMTQQQRWDEDFNNHLSAQEGAGKDQYNFAYDNYSRDLDDAVARGSMTSQDAAKARQHVINGVRAKQRQFHSDYLASYNNGDHTDSDRQGIRNTRIRTTHGDNGLVHFRHGDFGENTTFGGAERGYAQRDARMAAGGGRGGAGASTRAGANGSGARAGAGAQGGAPQMPTNNNAQAPTPNDAERAATLRWGPFGGGQQGNGGGTQTPQPAPGANAGGQGGTQTGAANGAQAAASKPSPITFKGGYTVGGVNGNIDWAAKGDGSINVGGAQLTAEQYNAFNNVRSSLANQLRQQDGLSHTEARARATQMANQWMADQTAVANGGKALNKWQHVENPQPAAQPAAPAQSTAQPAAPETPAQPAAPGGEIDPLGGGNTTPAQTGGSTPASQQPGTPGAQAQSTAQQAAGQPVTWDLEAGKKDPMGYIKHHTQALDADTIGGWDLNNEREDRKGWATQDGKLSQKGYYEGMSGRHYNNMQNLYQLVRDARLSDNERAEVMKALHQEASLYSQYKYTADNYARSTAAYKPAADGVDVHVRKKDPAAFGWNDYQARETLPVEIKDYINKYYD